ncbi:AraC family transcriptional regulator [Nocardioides silvaticus]|uniref:AraC family transcriptional regulator n=1 Tax=Nocardioides silvaticus TaxID=2201891 RepID=A0A316THQ8_9ACTN|nr:AraC family transcriptional regulator [Nocardioides silvaticus]PWN01884.1 AraC family transcriptional regulator [Nocardioides silvaticus]
MSDDVLTEALGQFGMTGVFYCVSDLAAPWGIDMPPMPGTVLFHLVATGSAVLEVDAEQVTMGPGDVVLVPRGTGHVGYSDADAPRTPLFDVPRLEQTDRFERIRIDGGGTPTTLVCGALEFTDLAVGRLMASLPPVLHAGSGGRGTWLRSTIELMAEEARSPLAGSSVVTTRLADVLVVHAVREWLRASAPERGWVAAVRDPHLGRAIGAFHADPGRAWDLPALAAAAGMSRSAFAAHFVAVLGETPMAYVASWRMDLAAQLVEAGGLSLAAVAERVGYRSEAAFNRAFRRAHGCTPGAWRRRSPLAAVQSATA